MTERWLPVAGYEGLYEVSDLGAVRGIVRGQVLSRFPDADGYLRVNLYRDGSPTQRGVHQLVLEAFVGPCPAGLQTLHADRDRGNNAPSNLSWGTAADNTADRTRHGTGPAGVRNPKARLTPEFVRSIRADRRVAREVAADFGVSIAAVRDVLHGRTWASA